MQLNPEGVAEPFPAPYGDLEKGKGWKRSAPYAATLATINAIDTFPYRLSPEGLVKLTNEIYPQLSAPSGSATNNREELVSLMRRNWLLTGRQGIADDEGSVGHWTARKIPEQVIVLVKWSGETSFRSYAAMNAYALKYGVAVPKYKIDQDKYRAEQGKEPVLSTQVFSILNSKDNESATIYLAHEGAYNEGVGLAALYGYPWSPVTQL
jgi:hypothetical protein